jgi:hypothetical protein
MSHYRSNLRDIEFNLFEVYRVQEHLGTGPFAQMDPETARQVLAEVANLAGGPFADSFVEGDRVPPTLDEQGNATLPESMHRALDAYFQGGWGALNLPEHLGGFGAPPSVAWAASAMLLGGNPAALMYCAGPFFAAIADLEVTAAQRERWIRPWVERQWGGTMVLTEPDAGSDVGAGRTKATDNGDGTWAIIGTKRFITNGDFDWPENIVHLVLARPVGAGGEPLHGPGTKGLSLYIVPKYWPEADGTPGERNPAIVRKLEDKMGLKASTTAEIEFAGARGVLVGERHDGIAQMFRVIEYARMLVGAKAIETLSTGYLNALSYARERVQGPDLKRATDKAAERVEIIRHPDVRRMLVTQKAHVEAMRALLFYAASIQDRIRLAEPGSEEAGALERLNDLLLPMVKGYGCERSYELLATSLQVLGGSGYMRDYPLEQYIRDAKIDSLYEGTTGIQGMDLFFRKVGKDKGATLAALLGEISEFAKGDGGNGALERERRLLESGLADVQGMLGAIVSFLGQDLYLVGLNTTPLLYALSELTCGWLILRQADVALAALAGDVRDADRAFYEGKVAAARWYARTVLPGLAARRAAAETTDLGVMDLDDAAW